MADLDLKNRSADSGWQRLGFPSDWSEQEIHYWRDLQERFLDNGDAYALHTIWGMRREGRPVHPVDVELMTG